MSEPESGWTEETVTMRLLPESNRRIKLMVEFLLLLSLGLFGVILVVLVGVACYVLIQVAR